MLPPLPPLTRRPSLANTKKQKQLMVTKESFAVASKDGIPRVITPDTPLWSNDPIVKKYPDSFEPLEDQVARRGPVVHTATSVPGEVRAADPVELVVVGDEYE